MRVEWQTTGDGEGFCAARLRKPEVPPAGYTRNNLVTEWLTLNCRGRWASKSLAASLKVRFQLAEDLERALERFGGERL